MSITIKEVDEHSFPLNGSRIHHQTNWPPLIAVGPPEICRLPKRQQTAIRDLTQRSTAEVPARAFLDSQKGNLYIYDFSTVIARVSPKGETIKYVQWV